jgi:hypothetical protein
MDYDYCTIKYYDPIGVQKISNEIPKSFELFQNYPNPFNPVTKIGFEIPITPQSPLEGGRGVTVRLLIYDILGREVAALVDQQLSPATPACRSLGAGRYEVEWDAKNFPSGAYYYRLLTNSYSETRKMILIK